MPVDNHNFINPANIEEKARAAENMAVEIVRTITENSNSIDTTSNAAIISVAMARVIQGLAQSDPSIKDNILLLCSLPSLPISGIRPLSDG